MSKARYALLFLVGSLALLLLILTSNDTVQNTLKVVIHEGGSIPYHETDSTPLPLLTDRGSTEIAENSQTAVERVVNCGENTASELSDEERKQRHTRRLEILSVSDDVEHVLVAALLGPVWEERFHMPTLERALEMSPDSVLVNWNLLQACVSNGNRAICDDIEERAIDVDGTNGAVWAEIAIHRSGKGDLRDVVDALRRANAAPVIDYYVVEHVQMFERAFAVDMNRSYAARIQEAMSITFWTNNGAVFLYKMCKDRAQDFELFREQCLQIGQRLEHEGNTGLDTLMALGIQREMLRISGDLRILAEVELKIQENEQEQRILSGRAGALEYDDQLADQYIEQWSAHGQDAAIIFVVNEIERLQSLPGYDPCPPVSNLEG